MKHLTVIVNPAAGKGKGKSIEQKLEAFFSANGFQCEIRETRGAGDAKAFAGNARCDMLACVGGDGTLSETLNGLLSRESRPPLCYVPLGSTNDLARSVGLPKKPMKAAECAVSEKYRELDAGSFNGQIFSYVACFGAFSRTSYITGRKLKNKLGHFAYVLTGAKELKRLHPYGVRVETENEVIEGNFLFGAVCNTRSLGGVLKLPAETESLSDGKHELLLVQWPEHISQMISVLFALARGKYEHPMLVSRHITEATFRMGEDTEWSLDGECVRGGKTVEFKNLPKSWRLMVPDDKRRIG